jgi:hypothetical protein
MDGHQNPATPVRAPETNPVTGQPTLEQNTIAWWRRRESNPRPKGPATRRTTCLFYSLDFAATDCEQPAAASPIDVAAHPRTESAWPARLEKWPA